MSSEFNRILKHSAIYGMSNILSKMVGFLLIPVYTRCLVREDYGLIEILQNTMNVMGILVGMGFAVAILRFYTEDPREETRETVICTSILAIAGVAAVIVSLGYVFRSELALLILQNRGYSHPFTVMLFILFFTSMIEIPLVIIRAREKSVIYLAACLAQLILGLSLNVLFIVVMKLQVAGWLLSSLWTSVTICTYLVISTFWSVRKIRFSFSLLKRMWTYTLPLIPANLAMFWIHNGDRYILIDKGLDDVGVYALGYKFAMMIPFLVGQPFFLIWSVRMFYVFEKDGGDKVYARTFTFFASVILLFWLVLCTTIKDVIFIISESGYHEAYLIVPIVGMGYVLREFSDFFKGVLLIKRRTSFVGYTTLFSALVCTVLYLVLIPRYGQPGAAWATFATFGTMALCMFLSARHVHKVPFEFRRLLVMSVLVAMLFLLCSQLTFQNPFLSIALKGLISLAFYPLLYFGGFFHDDEKQKIRRGLGAVAAVLRLKPRTREG